MHVNRKANKRQENDWSSEQKTKIKIIQCIQFTEVTI